MDAIALRQHTDFCRVFWRHKSTGNTQSASDSPQPVQIVRKNASYDSAKRALTCLALLNLPAHAYIQYRHIQAARTASKEVLIWTTTKFLGKIAAFMGLQSKVTETLKEELFHNELNKVMPYLAWSPSPGTSRPWTVVTHAFVHITTGHLLSNMFTLWHLTPTCSDIPGMNALHIIATAVGTSISGCAAVALETYCSPSLFSHSATTFAMGASAINSGLTVLAALALPGEKSGVRLGQAVDLKFANWLLAVMAITSDVGSLAVKHFTEQGRRQKPVPWIPQIGHSAHLGGATFAAVYYWLVLRRYGIRCGEIGAIEDAAPEILKSKEKELPAEGSGDGRENDLGA